MANQLQGRREREKGRGKHSDVVQSDLKIKGTWKCYVRDEEEKEEDNDGYLEG